ncbi:hypothetical protein H6F77_24735 [Microcoleus sp. FACHB-831]|nr:hypothetical protein [Microcoleus sp. FACHB-831]
MANVQEKQMENTAWLDLVTGGIAIAILISGIAMLLRGVLAFGDKKK